MASLRRDDVVGGYRILDSIGAGGMGHVYLAEKPEAKGVERTVALKTLPPGACPHDVELFTAEATTLAALSGHRAIIQLAGFDEDGDTLWLAQEYVDGRDLHELLDVTKSGLPVPLALYIATEVLSALQFAHEYRDDKHPRGIVHCDVKPRNVLVSNEGHVKLADFGIAKPASDDTATGTSRRGTFGYLAPELYEGARRSVRSDLYGVGLIVWELLTGRKLFAGSEAERMNAALEGTIPRLEAAGVVVSEPVEAVLHRLLARQPAERFQSAGAALNAILALPEGRQARDVDLKAHMIRPLAGIPRACAADSSPARAEPRESELSASRRRAARAVAGAVALVALVAVSFVVGRFFGAAGPAAIAQPSALDAGLQLRSDANATGKRGVVERVQETPAIQQEVDLTAGASGHPDAGPSPRAAKRRRPVRPQRADLAAPTTGPSRAAAAREATTARRRDESSGPPPPPVDSRYRRPVKLFVDGEAFETPWAKEESNEAPMYIWDGVEITGPRREKEEWERCGHECF